MNNSMALSSVATQASLRVIKQSLKALAAVVLVLNVAAVAHAAPSSVALDRVPAKKLSDNAAMQNGAKIFVSYCAGCHGVSAMRYSRLSDIGMTEEQIKSTILPPGAKAGDLMRASMSRTDAKEWFGAAPPDLSLTARSRSSGSGPGTDWIYTFLRTYVEDPVRPTGWNNTTYPGVGMPHVLWEMQKTLSPAEYDSAVGDLAAFLNYVSEPAQFTRKTVGVVVLIFLAIFFVMAWRLNKVYWKNIK
jgi:ubiquinol-cytochrome c reductase cytochrome c1 subunit